MLTIEKLGRKVIQIQGFLMTALFCMSVLVRLMSPRLNRILVSGHLGRQVQHVRQRVVHRLLCIPSSAYFGFHVA